MCSKTILVIDSQERLPGGTTDSFVVELSPVARPVRAISLLSADIPVPAAYTDAYIGVAISELQQNARGVSAGKGAWTFVVPIEVPPGYRTIWKKKEWFAQRVELPNGLPNRFTVSFRARSGPAGLTAESSLVLALEH